MYKKDVNHKKMLLFCKQEVFYKLCLEPNNKCIIRKCVWRIYSLEYQSYSIPWVLRNGICYRLRLHYVPYSWDCWDFETGFAHCGWIAPRCPTDRGLLCLSYRLVTVFTAMCISTVLCSFLKASPRARLYSFITALRLFPVGVERLIFGMKTSNSNHAFQIENEMSNIITNIQSC